MNSQNNPTQTHAQIPDRKFEEALITAWWRRTEMGGITHPIALKLLTDGRQLRLVRPTRKEYSRTHGRWYYPRDIDVLLYLVQSNSGGNRSAFLSICRLPPEMCSRIADLVASLWIGGASTKDVEKSLTLLQFF